MSWKRVVLLFILAVCACAVSGHVWAQNSPSCFLQYQICFLCGDPTPPGATCYVEITILSICTVPSAACPPAAAVQEACPTPCDTQRPSQTPPPFASEPVNLATGNTYIQQSDIRIPGLGGGLALVRTWSSKWPPHQGAYQVGMFGPNWRSTYEERVFLGTDNYMRYLRSDGSFWAFGYLGPRYMVMYVAAPASAGGGTVMVPPSTAAPNTTITFQNGEQRIFNGTSGALLSIIDRNGNTTTLTYDSANRLYQVTDPASRTLTFTYLSPSSGLVTGVSSSVGVSTSYAYDAQNRLSQVTNQDSTTLTFAYDSQSRITSVTDSNGKVLESHTYDSNSRGLTSSRALGVEAVTISY